MIVGSGHAAPYGRGDPVTPPEVGAGDFAEARHDYIALAPFPHVGRVILHMQA